MRTTGRFTIVAVSVLLLIGCKRTSADSAAAFDENSARLQIIAADSAFQRGLQSKHVDSLMIYYEEGVISLGGAEPIKGVSELRSHYDDVVKTNPRNLSFESEAVNFSSDHSMAWDYGTYSGTSDGPNGKPVTHAGSFMNVWRNVGGKWLIVAEMAT